MRRTMTKSSSKSGGGWTTRSSVSGKFVSTRHVSGRVQAHSSIGLPNGDRLNMVRRDIMDRALGRSPEKKV